MSVAYLPGHGARDGRWDPGARAPGSPQHPGGWIEADFTRAVALAAIGASPGSVLVSEGSYSERGHLAATLAPNAPVIQIHADAVADEVGPDRATVFWYPGNAAGEALANRVATLLRGVLPWPVQVYAAREDVSWHQGARSCLRSVAQTSVLIECGFTDGAEGRVRLPALASLIGSTLGQSL